MGENTSQGIGARHSMVWIRTAIIWWCYRSSGGSERLPTPVFWWEFHERYNPWSRKESDTTEPLLLTDSIKTKAKQKCQIKLVNYGSVRRRQRHPTPVLFCLENPMDSGAWQAAVHGSLRVGHDWAASLSLFTFMYWRRKWQPTPVFLPGESQGRGSLVGCYLWGRTESDTTEAP